MSLETTTLLGKLAAFIAAAAGLQHAATPRQLWIGEAIEPDAATVYSVMRCYTGAVGYVPVREASVQVKTIGPRNDDGAAWAQAQSIAASLCEPAGAAPPGGDGKPGGRPRRNFNLPALPASPVVRVLGILNLRGPGQVGRDDRGRVELVINFDVKYVPLAAA